MTWWNRLLNGLQFILRQPASGSIPWHPPSASDVLTGDESKVQSSSDTINYLDRASMIREYFTQLDPEQQKTVLRMLHAIQRQTDQNNSPNSPPLSPGQTPDS